MPEFRSRLQTNYPKELGLDLEQHTDSYATNTASVNNPGIYSSSVEISHPAINRMLQKLGKSAEFEEVDEHYMGNIAGMTVIENFNDKIKVWLRKGLDYVQKPFVACHELAHHIVDKYKAFLTHSETEEMCDRISCNELGLAYRPI